jgi:signal transduction histidine kinase
MNQRWLRTRPSLLVSGFGSALIFIAVVHHAIEFATIDDSLGPLLAVLLDSVPALGLVYAGYWLSNTDLSADGRWTVCVWCLGGAVLIGAVMGMTVLVRALEGRAIPEPVFPLLVAIEVGAIAGLIAGHSSARARADARQAETMSDALAFVNSLIRHDLRNDLNVIHGYAESVATTGPADVETDADGPSVIVEKTDEALTRIEVTGSITETLADDPELEPVDLAAITAEMATRAQEAFDVDVTTELPDRALVAANAGLRSVVDNVLENAAEHNDADEPWIHVDVTIESEIVRLSVSDNGPGIPDQHKAAIFDADTNGSPGGLSMVATLIDEYGGTVRVEDNDPRGSVFVAELPRAKRASGDGVPDRTVTTDGSPP